MEDRERVQFRKCIRQGKILYLRDMFRGASCTAVIVLSVGTGTSGVRRCCFFHCCSPLQKRHSWDRTGICINTCFGTQRQPRNYLQWLPEINLNGTRLTLQGRTGSHLTQELNNLNMAIVEGFPLNVSKHLIAFDFPNDSNLTRNAVTLSNPTKTTIL